MTKSEKISIRRNVPVPALPKRGPPYKYPWHDMEVGDMIEYRGCNQAARSCVRLFKGRSKNKKMKFRFEEFDTVVDGETKLYTNVWRIE